MALRLPRFLRSIPLVEGNGTPTLAFHQWWDTTLRQIENSVEDIRLALAAAGIALDGVNTVTTGWGAYTHTGASQSLAANVKQTLANNAGSVIETQKPDDVSSFYSSSLITGRAGDSIGVGIEFVFTPSDGTASNLFMAIDIGGTFGELYARDFPIFRGAGVPHKISYNIQAYTLNTWEANGGSVKVEADGPGVITDVRYVVHRLHKAK